LTAGGGAYCRPQPRHSLHQPRCLYYAPVPCWMRRLYQQRPVFFYGAAGCPRGTHGRAGWPATGGLKFMRREREARARCGPGAIYLAMAPREPTPRHRLRCALILRRAPKTGDQNACILRDGPHRAPPSRLSYHRKRVAKDSALAFVFNLWRTRPEGGMEPSPRHFERVDALDRSVAPAGVDHRKPRKARSRSLSE